MIIQAPPATECTSTVPPAERTVAICHSDPERFVHLLPGGSSNVLLTLDCPEAIEAAMQGMIDVLVIDANRVPLDALTAISFLQRERPQVMIYLYLEEEGARPVLQPWRAAA